MLGRITGIEENIVLVELNPEVLKTQTLLTKMFVIIIVF